MMNQVPSAGQGSQFDSLSGPGLDGGPGFDRLNGQVGVDSCPNGEVLVSCEASAAAAASQQLATTARATRGYGRQ